MSAKYLSSSSSSDDNDSSPMVTKPYKGKGVLLVEVPIFYEFEFDYDIIDSPNQQQQQTAGGALSSESIPRAKRRTLTSTKKLGISEAFDFTLPDGSTPLNDEMTRNLSQSIPSLCKTKNWLPLAQRLKGWKYEIRQRVGGRCDKFYQHERSEMQQFRSFKDVKRYLYLGFLPTTTLALFQDGENFLDLRLYISQQPDPQMSLERQ